eukprot:scaffold2973_cov67-Cylindrotheca_fusiformis.AAC.7
MAFAPMLQVRGVSLQCAFFVGVPDEGRASRIIRLHSDDFKTPMPQLAQLGGNVVAILGPISMLAVLTRRDTPY